MPEEKSRFLKVKEIQSLEHFGRDAAYELAKKLPHEKRGRDIFVFREAYEEYYEKRKQKALENQNNDIEKTSNVYSIKRFQAR